VLRGVGQLHEVGILGVLGGPDAGALAEDVDVQQRVGAQTVGAVHGDAGDLSGCVEPGDHRLVVLQDLCIDGGGDPAHCVVAGGEDRNRFGVGLHTQVG